VLLADLVADNRIFHQLICGRYDAVMHDRIVRIRRPRLSLDHGWNSTVAAGVTPCCIVDVGIGRLVPSIFLSARTSVFLPHSWILSHHCPDGFGNMMALPVVDRVELIQRRQQKRWGGVQAFSNLELLVLHLFTILIRKNAPRPPHRASDHHVPQSDVVFLTWRPSCDSHHQSDADRFEGPEHILRHRGGRGDPISAFREACDDDMVIAHATQGVSVTVMRRDARERRVFFVQELACSHVLRLHGTDSSHGVGLTVHGFSFMEDERPLCS